MSWFRSVKNQHNASPTNGNQGDLAWSYKERGERGGKLILFSAGFQGETVVAGRFFLNELKLKKNTIIMNSGKKGSIPLLNYIPCWFILYRSNINPGSFARRTWNKRQVTEKYIGHAWMSIELTLPYHLLRNFQLRLLVGRNHAKDDGPRVLARWSHCQECKMASWGRSMLRKTPSTSMENSLIFWIYRSRTERLPGCWLWLHLEDFTSERFLEKSENSLKTNTFLMNATMPASWASWAL